MKSASINEIKKELQTLQNEQILAICLRILKYKKENKELVSYLLFDAVDEQTYIESIKKEINEQFLLINTSNLYLVKKSLRKILKTANKYIKYSGSVQTGVEVLIYFCAQIKAAQIPMEKSIAIASMHAMQLKKINLLIQSMHEDLQFDYLNEYEQLIAGS